MASKVQYPGHKIDTQGIHAFGDTLKAVQDAPAPTNVTELRSYLGMVNHYGRFLPDLATVLAPMHQLLKKDAKWKWGQPQQESFNCTKQMLCSPEVVVHYSTNKPLVLICDASPYGVGAVLAHRMEDGSERPIAYHPRSSSDSEKNYAQIDHEALAIISGLTKFNQYIWGRPVTIVTDHKPLLGLLGPNKPVPQMISPRMQRWALKLSSFEYDLVYRPGPSIPEADALSRLPAGPAPINVPVPGDTIHIMQHMDMSPITSTDVRKETARDPVLSQVYLWVQSGYPDVCNEDNLRPYFQRRSELSIHDGCLQWGARVVIPPVLQDKVPTELHEGHHGVVRAKAVARSLFWWPSIDKAIEDSVKSCDACMLSRHKPPKAPLHPWVFPDRPWLRIHIDYAGPIMGKMILVVVDAYSKWIDAHISSGCTAAITILGLGTSFSTHGLPDIIVSDNATCITSEEFQHFCQMNVIRHITSAPHHPSSNGLAERAVDIVKGGIKRTQEGDMQTRLNRFLFHYRITPHTTTSIAPAELLMGRQLKSRLHLLRPKVRAKVELQQAHQKQQHDQHSKARSFRPDDPVNALVYHKNQATWTSGIIEQSTGPLSYTIRLDSGLVAWRHIDQLQSRITGPVVPTVPTAPPLPGAMVTAPEVPPSPNLPVPVASSAIPKPPVAVAAPAPELAPSLDQPIPETPPGSATFQSPHQARQLHGFVIACDYCNTSYFAIWCFSLLCLMTDSLTIWNTCNF